ncbi:5-carboxymethyl-2-hydroxymuconate Delta-isomerase [Piscibacillus salipiscarius]|uniref:5-carboxymethyl-2-hydroxymuconate Delta-isomerase n=1 Tax=Piscibacillus salipiscarius TaxID=299480 RepID=A0ABW5QAG5_9BACI|nr:5-carboxymethyl-2-hydroxymuconate Delta-isomerase [Piscibacillus salipiscarius]
MPHFTLEYTNNLKEEIDVSSLLLKINQALLKHDHIVPIGGLRSRAIELSHYVVADGEENDAFIHGTLKLGTGRTDDEKKLLCDEIYNVVTKELGHLFDERYLAFSLELYEFTFPTYKKNNIHERYKKKG